MTETTPNYERLVEQSILKGLLYLSEALQYYWPGKLANEKGGVKSGVINLIGENNIALQLARSFSENGFLVWAEVPFNNPDKSQRLDFLAYHYAEGILVALELKNSISTPQNNLEDLQRLVKICKMRLANEAHPFNSSSIDYSPHKMYGVISILESVEFADWWNLPNENLEVMTQCGRYSEVYKVIGQALDKADLRSVVPLIEMLRQGEYPVDYDQLLKFFRSRFLRAGYAVYNEDTVTNKLASIVN